MSASQLAYGRNYLLTFLPIQSSLPSIVIGSSGASHKTGRDRGLNISFVVKKSFPASLMTASANTCTIKIYNLTDSTAKALQVSGFFTFELGYGPALNEVFSGVLSKATSGREGMDTYIELAMVSGKIEKKSRYFNKAYAKGATRFQIIGDLVAKIQDEYFPDTGAVSTEQQLDPKDNIRYKTAQAKSGDAIQLLAAMLPKYNVVLNNRSVGIYPKVVEGQQLITKAPIFDLNPSTGLIDFNFTSTPSLEGADNMYAGVTAKTILYSQIDINFVFKLSIEDETLFYRVKSMEHTGQIYGGEFNTLFEGELIETMTGKV